MILDGSALVSVLLREADFPEFMAKMDRARRIGVGAPTLAETAMVVASRLGRDARPVIARLLRRSEIDVIQFHAHHYEVALDAFLRFGKGRHRAALNFGDCLAYAVARVAGAPLLCKRRDFALTDPLTAE